MARHQCRTIHDIHTEDSPHSKFNGGSSACQSWRWEKRVAKSDRPGSYDRQRAAAARSRAAIIDAARELFGDNPVATLTDVAKRAGVGPGTLYRHFPTRDDLIVATYQRDIDAITAAADEVLARSTSAKAAFIEWFGILAASIRVKHKLGDALHSVAVQAVAAEAWRPMAAAVRKLLDACIEEGTVASGHDATDVIMLMSFLWRVAPTAEGDAQAVRLIDTVFTGLQSQPDGSLPPPPAVI
ncbi:TetR/AcrR family transcriptional regulator [Mycobacteroides abscessus]|nr:TetR/AcrR family transcriptional regulator [Mycobacteroides abscessus]